MLCQTIKPGLAAKYFKPEEIASVKELGSRLIVTLKADENAEHAQQLKAELERENPDKKLVSFLLKTVLRHLLLRINGR